MQSNLAVWILETENLYSALYDLYKKKIPLEQATNFFICTYAEHMGFWVSNSKNVYSLPDIRKAYSSSILFSLPMLKKACEECYDFFKESEYEEPEQTEESY